MQGGLLGLIGISAISAEMWKMGDASDLISTQR